MSQHGVFEIACEALEQRTNLSRLEARGTLRIALRAAGVQPEQATSRELRTVIERILPAELDARGIEDSARVCRALDASLLGVSDETGPQSARPEDVFARLGGADNKARGSA